MSALNDLKAAVRRRFEFIEFNLSWEKKIGRKQLQDAFDISPQQATIDLNAYLDAVPGSMRYDPRLRTYIPRQSYRPQLTSGSTSEYLLQLEMLLHGYRDPSDVWIQDAPDLDGVFVRARPIAPDVLRVLLEAIRNECAMSATYVSLSSHNESRRTLLPHALANDGHRWHVRAYDVENERYSDFVISRIEEAKLDAASGGERPEDADWDLFVEVLMRPQSDLSDRQKEKLKFEYQMIDGTLVLKVRKAMLYYYLRTYGFNPNPNKNRRLDNNSSFSLEIENVDDVENWLGWR